MQKKSCIIPICAGEKFELVHKFPCDPEKYNDWIRIIKKNNVIEKIQNLDAETIRKKFFICCRHFELSHYKNIESRSLNVTAFPTINLTNLNDYKLSKAYQLEVKEGSKTEISVAQPNPSITILNTLFDSSSKGALNSKTILNSENKLKRSLEHGENEITPIKQIRLDDTEQEFIIIAKEEKLDNNFTDPGPVIIHNIEEVPVQEEKLIEVRSVDEESPKDEKVEEKSQNKLLALFEVSPDQYKKLSNYLSRSESNSNVESLLSFFNDDENENKLTDNEIELILEDERKLKLDLLWLRDHCRCDSCYDFSTYQRKVSILDIPDDIAITMHTIADNKLLVTWSDGHKSSYELAFLKKCQNEEKIESRGKIFWTKSEIEEPIKTSCRFAMRDYMSDQEVSKKVLESLHLYGVSFIDGVQATQHNTEFVIRQLFPIHKTLFGEMWTFSDEKRDHSDMAYTNCPHNDNTYFNDASGLQILHCIQHNCEGGETFLIDGFQVANKLRAEHPEVFKRLSTTLITAEYIEEGRHHKYSAPIINLDPITNEVKQVRFNLYDRAPMTTVPFNKIRQFYSDLKLLAREFENPDNRIVFKLQPGTVMIFDNWRVLHGRLEYEGKRTMTGCYVLRTEFESALRVNKLIE